MSEKLKKRPTVFEKGKLYFAERVDVWKIIEDKPARVIIGNPSCLSPMSALTMSLKCDSPPDVRAWGSSADVLRWRTHTAVLAAEAEAEENMPWLRDEIRECAAAIVAKLAKPNIYA